MATYVSSSVFDFAFNIRNPWYLASLRMNKKEKRLEVKFDYLHSDNQQCPFCGGLLLNMSYPIYKDWFYHRFFQFDTHMAVAIPTFRCSNCKCIASVEREAIINTLFLDILLMISPCNSVFALGLLMANKSMHQPDEQFRLSNGYQL